MEVFIAHSKSCSTHAFLLSIPIIAMSNSETKKKWTIEEAALRYYTYCKAANTRIELRGYIVLGQKSAIRTPQVVRKERSEIRGYVGEIIACGCVVFCGEATLQKLGKGQHHQTTQMASIKWELKNKQFRTWSGASAV